MLLLQWLALFLVVMTAAMGAPCFAASTGVDTGSDCSHDSPCNTIAYVVSACCGNAPSCDIQVLGLSPVALTTGSADVVLPNTSSIESAMGSASIACNPNQALRVMGVLLFGVTFNECVIRELDGVKGARLSVDIFVNFSLLTAFNVTSSVTIVDTFFSHSQNGAVLLRNAPRATIQNCRFDNNKHVALPGDDAAFGLLCMEHVLQVYVTNTAFSQSAAPVGAGLAVVSCSTVALSGCNFTFNVDLLRASETAGGALYAALSSVTVRNCTFSQNTASEGGAIKVVNSALGVSNSTFDGNFAVRGGALWINSQQPITFNESCIFRHNFAIHQGGIVYATDTALTFNDTRMHFNNGTGVETMTGVLVMSRCDVLGQGGAPIAAQEGNVALSDSVFSINSGGLGGALSLLETDTRIVNCLFVSNIASQGGAIFAEGGSLTAQNTSFLDNIARDEGGGALMFLLTSSAMNSSIVFSNCTFRSSPVAAVGVSGSITITDSLLVSSGVSSVLAPVSIADSLLLQTSAVVVRELTMQRTNVSSSTRSDKHITFASGSLTDVQFRNIYGTAIQLRGSATLLRCSFTHMASAGLVLNGAARPESPVVIDQDPELLFVGRIVFDSCTFANNSGFQLGGAILRTASSVAEISIENCVFFNNSASIGGAIYAATNYALTMQNVSFVANTGIQYGNNVAGPVYAFEFVQGVPRVVARDERVVVTVRVKDFAGNVVIDQGTAVSMLIGHHLAVTQTLPNVQVVTNATLTFDFAPQGGVVWSEYNVTFMALITSTGAFVRTVETFVLLDCGFGRQLLDSGVCQPCRDGEYSFDSVSCLACPVEGRRCASASSGSSAYDIEARVFVTRAPRLLLECPQCNTSSCRRDCVLENRTCVVSCDDARCAAGYEGFRCTRCAAGWFPDNDGAECIMCESSAMGNVMLGISIAIGLGLFVALIALEQTSKLLLCIEAASAIALIVLQIQGAWAVEVLFIVVACVIATSATSLGHRNGIVKTIIFFVQIVMVLFRDSLWPQWWDTVARALRFLNVRVSGIPCVADAFRDDALAFFLQMLFPWALVFVVSVVVLLRHLIVTRCLKRKVVLLLSPHDDANDSDLDGAIRSHGGLSHDGLVWDVQKAPQKSDEALERLRADGSPQTPRELMLRTVIVVFYVGYFELVLRIFSVWNIVVFAPGLSYLQELPWVEASFANRTYVLLFVQAVVFGVVYVIGVPLFYGFLLMRNRERIERGQASYLAFLHEDYRHSLFFFELVLMARRALLALLVALMAPTSQFRSFLITAILTLSLAVSVHLKPFNRSAENWLESLALACVLATFSGLNDTLRNELAFQWFAASINLCVLLLLVGMWLWPLLAEGWRFLRRRCCANYAPQ